MLRLVTPEDAPRLLAIYSQYIDTPITFETILPTEAEFAARIADIAAAYPYLAWEEDGQTLGYAYAHRYQERAAYQWNAELSVYVDSGRVAQGAGRRLYGALMELLRLQGVRTVYGIVTLPNERSERLHKACGFRLLGVYQGTGYKNGSWRDVGIFEKHIAPLDASPVPLLPFPAVPRERVAEILRRLATPANRPPRESDTPAQ